MVFKVPSFYGVKDDPDEYLEWEKKMELYFKLHHLHGEEKMLVAIGSFHLRAKRWWQRFKKVRADRTSIPTWKELKKAMRKKFATKSDETQEKQFVENTLGCEFMHLQNIIEMRKDIAELTTLLNTLSSQINIKNQDRDESSTCYEEQFVEKESSTSKSEATIEISEGVALEVELGIEHLSCDTNSLWQDWAHTLDVVEEELDISSYMVDTSLAIVPYQWAKHDEDLVYPLPCSVPYMPVHIFELPIIISIPPVEKVQYIDFVFGD